MKYKILFTLIFIVNIKYYGQNVGVNTSTPQAIFHIDPAKNTSGTTNVSDDMVVNNKGRIGIGTLTPNATVEVAAKDNTVTSTTAEGILVPRVSRDRAKAMVGVEEGTIIFVNDITGYNTDATPGTAKYISREGLYYFNGTEWSMFENVYTRTDGSQGGLSIRKVKWFGDVTNAASEELQCGRFKFKIRKYATNNYRIQWALVSGSKTVRALYRNVFNDGNPTLGQSDLLNVSTTLTTTYVDTLSNYFIPTNDIHDLYITYDGDTDYYQVTLARIENDPNVVTDNLNVITCKKY